MDTFTDIKCNSSYFEENFSTSDQKIHVRSNMEETGIHGITLMEVRGEAERKHRVTTNWSTEANYCSGESIDLDSLSMSYDEGTETVTQEEDDEKIDVQNESADQMLPCWDEKCHRPENDVLLLKQEKLPTSFKIYTSVDYSVQGMMSFCKCSRNETTSDKDEPTPSNMIEIPTSSSTDPPSEVEIFNNNDVASHNTGIHCSEEATTLGAFGQHETPKFSERTEKYETKAKENLESKKQRLCQSVVTAELNSTQDVRVTTSKVEYIETSDEMDTHATSIMEIDRRRTEKVDEKDDENNENDDVFQNEEEGEGVDDIINEDDAISRENKINEEKAEPCYNADDIFDAE